MTRQTIMLIISQVQNQLESSNLIGSKFLENFTWLKSHQNRFLACEFGNFVKQIIGF